MSWSGKGSWGGHSKGKGSGLNGVKGGGKSGGGKGGKGGVGGKGGAARCRFFFEQGFCQSGDGCQFLHRDPQAQAAPAAPCRFVLQDGFCRNGDSCQFVHTA
jgi:hypothetical protein